MNAKDISSKLAEIRERRVKNFYGVDPDLLTLLSIIDSLQAENKSLQGWKTRTIARCEEVDRLLDASAAEHTRLRSQIEELQSAASNMKAKLVKRVRAIGIRDDDGDALYLLNEAAELLATELEAVELPDVKSWHMAINRNLSTGKRSLVVWRCYYF